MKIYVCGTRGFPNMQGGIETHCEELYPRIARLGYDVTVVRRKSFIAENPVRREYKGVKFKDIYSPKITGFEAAVHSLLTIYYAYRAKADIVHIHAIGPAIVVPLAKMAGLKVIVTHHGPDYDREKWGFFSRLVLKTGEFFAAKLADEVIVISTVIKDILKRKYNRTKNVHLIYNGVTTLPNHSQSTGFLQKSGIKPGKYILAVGRFVEEKRFDKLIEACIKLKREDYQLVIAGDSDYETSYACYLKNFAIENHVILTGVVKGEALSELYGNAALFVLPSSHEGLPITMLEAMSYKRKIVASNIPANLAVNLDADSYFELNDLNDLVHKIAGQLNNGCTEKGYDLSLYDWDTIALQTKEVYVTP
ncbi:Mannosylfructose-phosphate synthase [Bacteroidales bacterium Barb6]|nr:Mannosylfructose-phosphate synthase [Bacteroidales bacterium Barb6]